MRAAYEANPELIGQETKFTVPDSVYQDSVVSTTGTKSGTFKANNGSTYSVSGGMKTDWFKKDFPPMNPRYDFMVGATPEELSGFWNKSTAKPDDKKTTTTQQSNNNQQQTPQSQTTQSQTTQEPATTQAP